MTDKESPVERSNPTEMVTQIGELFAGAVTEATQKAEQAPDLAKAEARKVMRRWYGLIVSMSAVIALVVAFVALTVGLGARSAADALVAAQQVSTQNQRVNLDEVRRKVDEVNRTVLGPQGKPLVPLPTVPAFAGGALALANLEQLFSADYFRRGPQGIQGIPGVAGKPGRNGEPPESWVARNADGSTMTCLRAFPFDPDHPMYGCTTTGPPAAPTPAPTSPMMPR